MNEKFESLLERMHSLEKEILRELQKKELEFFYEVRQGKVRFAEKARARHKLLVKRFASYIRESRFWIIATGPVIWVCIILIAIMELFMIVYQAICFPVYGIPNVKRSDYIRLDRRHLAYLNWAEKLNCGYATVRRSFEDIEKKRMCRRPPFPPAHDPPGNRQTAGSRRCAWMSE